MQTPKARTPLRGLSWSNVSTRVPCLGDRSCNYSSSSLVLFKEGNNSLEVPQKRSPRGVSSEVLHKNSRAISSDGHPKISPRVVCQLKTSASKSDSASSSNQESQTPKVISIKNTERRSPRSLVTETQKKSPSKLAELESQILQLEDDLKKVKDELSLSESWKKQALQQADESKKQLLAMSSKLEESQKRLLEKSASEEVHVTEIQRLSEEQDQAWKSKIEAIQQQYSAESAALASAMNEIQQLKVQLETVAESEATQTLRAKSAGAELHSLKENLAETFILVEDMKNQLRDCKESETQAQALVGETLLQLEMAKRTVDTLRVDGVKAVEAYNSISHELDQSRARLNLLEDLVNKLRVDTGNAVCNNSQNLADEQKVENEIGEGEKSRQTIEAQVASANSEVERLRAALETAEIRYQEEQIISMVQIRNAYDLGEQIKSASNVKEAELQEELKKLRADIEELKANLMDKETELQGICEENEGLNLRLEKTLSGQKDYQLEKELKKSKENVECLKVELLDKETELLSTSDENQRLKLEIQKKDMDGGNVNDELIAELEAAKAAGRESLLKLGYAREEADKSSRRAARVAEQLEAAQVANSEMEAELRRLKVQSDQWRKAAEAAVAMLSAGNNGKLMEKTGSLDRHYSPIPGSSPYSEDMDDLLKKKNGNMLKRIGVLWNKPNKKKPREPVWM